MTSRPKLAVVAHEAAEAHAPRAETVLRQSEPEAQLVGALMHLTRAHVTPILELVPDTAIWRPDNRWAYVMYSRTLFGSPAKLVLDELFRRRCALAANPRNKSSGTNSVDIECVLIEVGCVVEASFAVPHAVIDKEVSR